MIPWQNRLARSEQPRNDHLLAIRPGFWLEAASQLSVERSSSSHPSIGLPLHFTSCLGSSPIIQHGFLSGDAAGRELQGRIFAEIGATSLKARGVSGDCLSVHLRSRFSVILPSNLVGVIFVLSPQHKLCPKTCRYLSNHDAIRATSPGIGDMSTDSISTRRVPLQSEYNCIMESEGGDYA